MFRRRTPAETAETPDYITRGVTWGPIAATLYSVATYLTAQYAGLAIIVFFVATPKHWTLEQTASWLDHSVVAQFVTMAVIELITISMLIWFLRFKKASFKSLGWNRRPQLLDAAYALGTYALYFISVNVILLNLLTKRFHVPDQPQQIGFHDNVHGPGLVLVFIALTILPPLVEETMVRGFLYSGLRAKLPKLRAALITSLLFGIAHLQLGAGAPPVWVAAIDTFFLSLFLINLREKTGSLYASMGVHFLKNFVAFLAIFVFHV